MCFYHWCDRDRGSLSVGVRASELTGLSLSTEQSVHSTRSVDGVRTQASHMRLRCESCSVWVQDGFGRNSCGGAASFVVPAERGLRTGQGFVTCAFSMR